MSDLEFLKNYKDPCCDLDPCEAGGVPSYKVQLDELQTYADSLLESGKQLFELEDYKSALEEFQEASKLMGYKMLAYLYHEALTHERLGDSGKAIEIWTKGVQLANEDETVSGMERAIFYFYRGQLHERKCQPSEAVDDLSHAITMVANARGSDTQFDEYGRLISTNHRLADAYFYRGKAHERLDRRDGKAVADYLSAWRLRNNFAEASYRLGCLYVDTDQRDKAVAAFTEAIKAVEEFGNHCGPDAPNAADSASAAPADSSNAAQPTTPEAIAEAPRRYRLSRGWALVNRTKPPQEKDLRDAITDFDIVIAEWLDGRKLEHEACSLTVAAFFRRGVANEGLARVSANESRSQRLTGPHLDAAIKDFRQVLQLDPTQRDAHLRLSALYKHREDPEAARRHHAAAKKLMPDLAQAFFDRAIDKCAEDRTRKQRISDLSEAIRLKEDFAEAYYMRGLRYREEPADLDEAIKDFERALYYQRDHTLARYFLAKCHEVQGDFREAVRQYSTIIDSGADNKTDISYVYKARGNAYHQLGLASKAHEDFRRAKETR